MATEYRWEFPSFKTLPTPTEGDPFVAFEDLTEAWAIARVVSAIDLDELHATLDAALVLLAAPAPVDKPAPFAAE